MPTAKVAVVWTQRRRRTAGRPPGLLLGNPEHTVAAGRSVAPSRHSPPGGEAADLVGDSCQQDPTGLATAPAQLSAAGGPGKQHVGEALHRRLRHCLRFHLPTPPPSSWPARGDQSGTSPDLEASGLQAGLEAGSAPEPCGCPQASPGAPQRHKGAKNRRKPLPGEGGRRASAKAVPEKVQAAAAAAGPWPRMAAAHTAGPTPHLAAASSSVAAAAEPSQAASPLQRRAAPHCYAPTAADAVPVVPRGAGRQADWTHQSWLERQRKPCRHAANRSPPMMREGALKLRTPLLRHRCHRLPRDRGSAPWAVQQRCWRQRLGRLWQRSAARVGSEPCCGWSLATVRPSQDRTLPGASRLAPGRVPVPRGGIWHNQPMPILHREKSSSCTE